ncbi:MAG: aminoacyl-tRNA hydrolase [Oscillospiraceae bacterium]|jgi:PTH1 family peptidyl-tRNA hydrolase|nr:aminoacyl-tRNA hydrolase [Oscillospiraceae bacterium]
MPFFKRFAAAEGGIDWVIAGLGNPGKAYENTRHNVGFLVLDRLAEQWGIPLKKLKFQSLYGVGRAEGARVALLKPQTFMNRSGEALRECLGFFKVPCGHMLVVYDDVALPPGRLRVRVRGSDGGHNGIKSILYQCKTDEFPRVKVGVGAPPHPDFDLKDWVLGPFAKTETPAIGEALDRACQAVSAILRAGAESAMNQYNGK